MCFGEATNLVINRVATGDDSRCLRLNFPLTLSFTFAEFTLGNDSLDPTIAPLHDVMLTLDESTLVSVNDAGDTIFLPDAIDCPAEDPGDDAFFIRYDAILTDRCGVVLHQQVYSTTCCGPNGDFGCDQICGQQR